MRDRLTEMKITSNPESASRAVTVFVRAVQDAMDDEERQDLKRLIPMMLGSRDSVEVEGARCEFLAHWALKAAYPLALEACGAFRWSKLFREWPGIRSDAVLDVLKLIADSSRDIPLVDEVADRAVIAYKLMARTDIVSGAASLVVSVMTINDTTARMLCLAPYKRYVERIPGLCESVIRAIEHALKLGRHGVELDWRWLLDRDDRPCTRVCGKFGSQRQATVRRS